jgi:hypothetical protein
MPQAVYALNLFNIAKKDEYLASLPAHLPDEPSSVNAPDAARELDWILSRSTEGRFAPACPWVIFAGWGRGGRRRSS